MGLWLKQSTAITVKIGPFIDDGDGKTAETGLTLTQADIRLSKNGANIAQKNEANAATTDELGYYDCPLDATDTGTLGILQLFVHESGALPVFHEYMVVPANVWDSMFGADKLDVNTAELANIDFGATMKASINAEVDTALNTAIPGAPTLDSVNEILSALSVRLPADYIMGSSVSTAQDDEVTAIKAVTDTLSLGTIADAVWDEVISAGAHDVANSPAIYLRNLYQTLVTRIALATAGAGGTITLDGAASAVDDYYKGQVIALCGGLGAGQARACYAYNGATKIASVRPNWATTPNGTSWYAVLNVGSAVVAYMEDAVTDQIFDETTETGVTLRQNLNIILAALAGKSSGGGTATIKFRDQADTKDRITATVTAVGNRTAITNDGA